jgi:hypothetical protein
MIGDHVRPIRVDTPEPAALERPGVDAGVVDVRVLGVVGLEQSLHDPAHPFEQSGMSQKVHDSQCSVAGVRRVAQREQPDNRSAVNQADDYVRIHRVAEVARVEVCRRLLRDCLAARQSIDICNAFEEIIARKWDPADRGRGGDGDTGRIRERRELEPFNARVRSHVVIQLAHPIAQRPVNRRRRRVQPDRADRHVRLDRAEMLEQRQSEPRHARIVAHLPGGQPNHVAVGEGGVEAPRRYVAEYAEDRTIVPAARDDE